MVKTTETKLPASASIGSDAMTFHTQIDTARLARKTEDKLYPIGGCDQPTATTARIEGTQAICLRTI